MKKDNKRADLLKVAAGVFARHGYEKTTLEDIAVAAGLNKATLYYYFKDKEAIFSGVVMSELATLMASLRKQSDGQPSAEQKILYYIRHRWTCYEKALNISEVADTVRERVSSLLRNLYQQIQEEEINYLTSVLKYGLDQKEFKGVDPSFAALLVTMWNGIKRETFIKHLPSGKKHSAIYRIVKTDTEQATLLLLNGFKNNKR